jgi:hypothetical protein
VLPYRHGDFHPGLVRATQVLHILCVRLKLCGIASRKCTAKCMSYQRGICSSLLSQRGMFADHLQFFPQGVAHLVDRLPSGLLEKMFSHSLDTLSPLSGVERSPSDILDLAPTLEKAIMDRICSGSLDRICSTNLERLWSGSV